MGRKRCAVMSCNSSSSSSTLSFFRLPSNPKERENWLDFLKTSYNDDQWIPAENCYVCSLHFERCCTQLIGSCLKIVKGHYPSHPLLLDGIEFSNVESVCLKIQSTEDHIKQNHNLSSNCENCARLQSELDVAKTALEVAVKGLTQLRSQHQESLLELRKFHKREARLVEKRKRDSSNEKVPEMHLIKKTQSEQTQTSGENDANNELSPILLELIKRHNVLKSTPYSEIMKEFSMNIQFYSAKAYDVLRKSVNKTLPHPRIFHKWTKFIETRPGFIPVSLNYFREKAVNEYKDSDFYCALMFDEIHIRKQVIFDGKRMKGFVEYGDMCQVDRPNTEASAALFIMAVEIKSKKRVPIGYILTNGLNANLMSAVVKKSLEQMERVGVKCISVTFDGLASNFTAMEQLGANLDPSSDSFKPFIPHPSADRRVYIIPDPVHMFKLLRNSLEFYKSFMDSNGNKVDWDYFVKLQRLQEDSGVRAGNKLTSRVVNFKNEKMKVKLMTHLFSQSVATSLDVCRILNIPGFEGSEPTSNFVKLCDRLFDALNSKPCGKGYKAPLSASNRRFWIPLFKEAKNYLMELECRWPFKKTQDEYAPTTDKWVLLRNSRRNTCIRGLYTCISSVELILNDMSASVIDLSYLPVYKLCQDSIEIFFSILRSRFGNNNNPNTAQLESALKRVLCINIKPTSNGNCTVEDDFCSRVCPLGRIFLTTPHELEEQEEEDLPEIPDSITLSQFVSNVVVYIAGFVGRSLFKKIKCADCIASLIPEDLSAVKLRSDFILINEKNNGGLFIPSSDLIEVCNVTETEIRCNRLEGLSQMRKQVIAQNVVKRSSRCQIFEKLRTTNSTSHLIFGDHVITLIGKIAEEYTKIRLHYMAKEATLKISPDTIRSSCTKAVHFKGN